MRRSVAAVCAVRYAQTFHVCPLYLSNGFSCTMARKGLALRVLPSLLRVLVPQSLWAMPWPY
jgi:hypothetical protein